jgi:hypothetical protein
MGGLAMATKLGHYENKTGTLQAFPCSRALFMLIA